MTYVGPRRTGRARATRERILETTGELLAESGYTATSLEEIAARAGLSVGTIYYHFDSKEDLYWSLVFPRLALDVELVTAEADRNHDPIEALWRILAFSIERARDPRNRYMYYREMLPLRPDMRKALRDQEREYESVVARLIRAGQAQGRLVQGDAKVIALVVLGSVARTARWYDINGPVPPDEFSRIVLRINLEGLLEVGVAPPTFDGLPESIEPDVASQR